MKKKTTFIIALALSCILLFGACGGGNEPPPIINPGVLERSGTIKVMLPTSDYAYSDNALKAVAQSYMDKYPDVTVIVDAQPSSTYKDWLDTQLAGGEIEPDIVQTLLISSAYTKAKLEDFTDYLLTVNPHSDNNTLWRDALSPDAYKPADDRSGIYSLSLNNTSSFFFYNRDAWQAAGLVDGDGNDRIPKTWDELEEMSILLENNWASKQPNRSPIAIGGDSFTYEAMEWLLNIYMDQYFRDIAEDIHARPGDFIYDVDIDADWEYDVTDPNNDSLQNYNYNPLRFLRMVEDGDMGTNNVKYKAMLKNFIKVIPTHAQAGFSSNNYLQAANLFWEGNAAIVYKTTDFFNTFKHFFEDDSNAQMHRFDMGFFPAPPMTGEGAEAPAADYVRSVGGATGWYGVIKKDKKQVDLVMDFLMYLGSVQGTETYLESIQSQGAYVSGPTNVLGIRMDESVYPATDYPFPGLCHNNPMGGLFGKLATANGPAGQSYNLLAGRLFNNFDKAKGETITDADINTFAQDLQTVLSNSVKTYINNMNWRSDALNNVALDPRM